MSSELTLQVLHFNDVYKITRARQGQKEKKAIEKNGDLHDDFDRVLRFSMKIQQLRDSWAQQGKEGLLLFSGDLFSPSVESMLTRGRSMVHLMNVLSPDACVPGNHEFDFKRERFNQLVEFCTFPWILSNVEEKTKTNQWDTLKDIERYRVIEVNLGSDSRSVKIGIIGLMSADAHSKIDTSATKTFKLQDMHEKGMQLAKELRGEPHKCELVFALTHALIVKSGTDFEDLSEVSITLEEPVGQNLERKMLVKSVKVIRHHMPGCDLVITDQNGVDITAESLRKCPLSTVLNRLFKHQVLKDLKKPVAERPEPFDVSIMREGITREGESIIGNWIADSIVRWMRKHHHKVPEPLIFITTGGSIRASSPFESVVKQGDIIQLLPFNAPLIICKMAGAAIWQVLEEALSESEWDGSKIASAGKFPVVSGVKVTWRSDVAAKQRIQSIKLTSSPQIPITKTDKGLYYVLTDKYLIEGGDDLKSFKNHTDPVDTEVPMYEALLQDIADISVEDAAAILTGTFSSFPLGRRVTGPSKKGLLGVILNILGQGALMNDFRVDGWEPDLVEQTVANQVMEVAKAKKLPVLRLPTKIDERMKDVRPHA
ncbi:unnamed protein product [Rhizoctonia solani]|uniref:5'-nucleotidase n=1 Tax=Rhizoctonia solani TaxID=456999 RepID=A0A8H3BG88_9AGAM|nr:unnamed protein product [Rhizoctonia solani]